MKFEYTYELCYDVMKKLSTSLPLMSNFQVYFMTTIACIQCITADPSAGRVDTSMLTDQDMLELLAQGFDKKSQERFQEDGEFIDFHDWDIVEASVDDHVTYLNLGPNPHIQIYGPICGTLEAKFIPRKAETLAIEGCAFEGALDFAHLPAKLKELIILKTPFEGSIDVQALPSELWDLNVQKTKHSGSIDFTALPKSLKFCELSGCKFSGSANFSALPTELRLLNISDNDFSGSVDLLHLPTGLNEIDLSSNAFSGSVCLDNLPIRMDVLDLGDNMLTGELSDEIVQNLPWMMLRFGINNNDFWGKVNLWKCREYLDVCVRRDLPEHRKAKAMQNTRLEIRMRRYDDFYDYDENDDYEEFYDIDECYDY